MTQHGYRPLGNRQNIRDLVELARHEIAEVAARYVDLIDQAIDAVPASQAGLAAGPNDRR